MWNDQSGSQGVDVDADRYLNRELFLHNNHSFKKTSKKRLMADFRSRLGMGQGLNGIRYGEMSFPTSYGATPYMECDRSGFSTGVRFPMGSGTIGPYVSQTFSSGRRPAGREAGVRMEWKY
jgi:hypothetical protein